MENNKETLYELNTGCNEFGNFVKLVANLMSVEYHTVVIDEQKDSKLMKKSFTGKFPVLELQDGKTCLSEPLTIAKYLARDNHSFYGTNICNQA